MNSPEPTTVQLTFTDLAKARLRSGGWLANVTAWPADAAPGLEFSKAWNSANCTATAPAQPGAVLFGGCGSKGSDSGLPSRLKFRHFYPLAHAYAIAKADRTNNTKSGAHYPALGHIGHSATHSARVPLTSRTSMRGTRPNPSLKRSVNGVSPA